MSVEAKSSSYVINAEPGWVCIFANESGYSWEEPLIAWHIELWHGPPGERAFQDVHPVTPFADAIGHNYYPAFKTPAGEYVGGCGERFADREELIRERTEFAKRLKALKARYAAETTLRG
jgi:hypothetical protein